MATATSNLSISNVHIGIPLGIIIGLLASFVQSLGLTIQRKSHVLNQQLPERDQRVEHRRPLWLLGFAIFISSNILGSLVQIASLPVVILAPLGAVSLLWNAFFARFLLGDVFSPWMILGTLLIAGGAVLIAIFGIVSEPTRSLEDLLELFRRPTFVAYFSLLGAVVVVCLVITHVVEYSFSRKLVVVSPEPSPPMSPLSPPATTTVTNPSALSTGVTETLTTERTPLLDRKPTSHSASTSPVRLMAPTPATNRTRLLLAISYASFSGIISGMCLLFAKSGVELLLLTLRGQNQFWRWQAWVLVLGLVAFALLQLWYLHKGLVLADPTLVCPSAFCFYNLSSIVNGLVYFNQFQLIPPLHLGLVVLGIVILLGGVWVVSIQSGGGVDLGAWHEEDEEMEEVSESEDEDQALPDVERPPSENSDSRGRHDRRWGVGPMPMERETRSESHVPTLVLPSPPILPIRPRPTTIAAPSLSGQDRHVTDPLLLSPSSTRRRRRRPTVVSTIERSGTLPLSPPMGTGLQIGLSPLSPGFAPVPKERRRRISGLSHGDAGSLEGRERRRRRTVSEGDVGRVGVAGGDEGEWGVSSEFPERNALLRWKWLRRVFVG